VNEAIEHGVGQGGVADGIVPDGDRQLARHDGRAPAVAIFEDLQQVTPLGVREGMKTEIVKDEDVGPCEVGQQLGVAAIRRRGRALAARLAVLNAYFRVHAQLLPDGRLNGLSESMGVIRARYIGLPGSQPERLQFLRQLDPRDFEHLIDELYSALGGFGQWVFCEGRSRDQIGSDNNYCKMTRLSTTTNTAYPKMT
jgi:hypothetical protein